MSTDASTQRTGIHESYLLVLSKGPSIQFDPSELPKVRAAIKSGNIAALKRGMFNPSFFVSIVRDEERVSRFLEDTKYSDSRSKQRRLSGMKPLSDIFEEAPLEFPSAHRLPSARDG